LQAQLDLLRGETAAARVKLQRSLQLYEKTGAKVEAAVFHAAVAETLSRADKHPGWALEILEATLPVLEEHGRSESMDTLYGVQIGLLRQLGRTDAAWAVHEQREAFRKDHAAERMQERSQYLDTVFRVARKDREIRAGEIARARAETQALQARNDRNVALGVVGAAVIGLGLLAWQFFSVREANALISRQRDELARLNADKDAFMRIASHDLKTPLAGIRLTLGMLRRGSKETLTSGDQQTLQDLENAAGQSLEMVSAFLDDQLEHSDARVESLTVHDVIQAAVAEVSPLAKARDVVLQTDAPHQLTWPMDRLRTERVLVNLLSNALAVSSAGETVQVVAAADPHQLTLKVVDSGPGLGASSETPNDKSPGLRGHGQGLVMVRQLATAMGAEFALRNRAGARGACATLTLPRR
jgi:signal transduction histidine kinase